MRFGKPQSLENREKLRQLVDKPEFAESKAASQGRDKSGTTDDGFMSIPDGLEDEGLLF